jgi:hypothetical protein
MPGFDLGAGETSRFEKPRGCGRFVAFLRHSGMPDAVEFVFAVAFVIPAPVYAGDTAG